MGQDEAVSARARWLPTKLETYLRQPLLAQMLQFQQID
jgi:hypothetical protein